MLVVVAGYEIMRSSSQSSWAAGKYILTVYSTESTLTYYNIHCHTIPDRTFYLTGAGAGLGDQGMSHQADSQPASQPAPLTGRKAELCMTAGHD